MIGKKIRLERIINRNTGRTVIAPMDHGVSSGPIPGIIDMDETVESISQGGADAILMHKGIVKQGHRGYGKDIFTPDASVDLADLSKSEFFEEIKDERAREFGYELLRKDDIVRWGEFTQRMKYMKSVAATIPESYTSSYYHNARRYYNNSEARDELWPIPTFEMGVNRKLVQNTGW